MTCLHGIQARLLAAAFLIWLPGSATVFAQQLDAIPTRAEIFKTARKAARTNLADGVEKTRLPLFKIPFGLRSTELTDEALPGLATIAQVMREPALSEATLRLEGHADAVGSASSNFTVSLNRAIVVRNALSSLFGVDEDRLKIEGFGEGRLLGSEDPESDLQRRVEVTLEFDSAAFAPRPTLSPPAGVGILEFGRDTPPKVMALANPFDSAFGQTVDVWVSAEWDDDAVFEEEPLVYALRGPQGLRQSVHVTAERDGLAYFDGDYGNFEYTRVPFDFSDGKLHHVAVTTYEDETVFVVDGEVAAVVPRGLSPVAAAEVLIGGSDEDGGAFVGRIGGLRIWNSVLLPDDLATLSDNAGDPGPGAIVYDNLVAVMTVEGDEAFAEMLAPVIQIPDGAWTTFGSDHVEIHNELEFHAGSKAELYSGHLLEHARRGAERNTRTFSTYPLFLLQTELPSADGNGRFAGGSSGNEAFDISVPIGWKPVRIEVRTAPDGIDAMRFVAAKNGRETTGPWLGELREGTVEGVLRFPTGADVEIIGIEGYAGNRIHQLSLITPSGTIGPVGLADKDRPRGSRPFRRFVPTGAAFRGFEALTAPFIESLAIGSTADPSLPAIVLHQEDGTAARFEQTGRNAYRAVDGANPVTDAPQAVLTVVSPEIVTIDGISRDIVPITLHDQPDPEDAFDNVFIAQSKAVNLSASYQGYDITRMDPLHLVESGTNKNVFRLPGAGSTDYHDHNRIFVPNGLMYVAEFTGKTRVNTTTIKTSDDLRKSYSSTVGVDFSAAGFGFSNSRSFNESVETLSGKQREMSTSIARATFYDLVLDKARMPLSAAFRARVLRLLETRDYRSFVKAFGTHYPAAVVYGGMGIMQMEYTAEMRRKVEADGSSLETHIHGAAEKMAGSFNSSESREQSATFEKEFGNQTENFYWVGGAHAGGSKDSWSVGEDGAVPVYVELRPLSELLAPPYYTDPVILRQLRPGLDKAIKAYMAEQAAGNRFVGAEVPRIYELEFVSLRTDSLGDEPNTQLELRGQVTVEVVDVNPADDSGTNAGDEVQVLELEGGRDKLLLAAGEILRPIGEKDNPVGPVRSAMRGEAVRRKVFAVAPDIVDRRGRLRIEASDFREEETGGDSLDRLGLLGFADTDVDDELVPTQGIQFLWSEGTITGETKEIRLNGCDSLDNRCSDITDVYLVFRLREIFPENHREITDKFTAARGAQ